MFHYSKKFKSWQPFIQAEYDFMFQYNGQIFLL